ncbi:MAG: MaoC/PaaZ C-terminal domain-containing protein [SAR324 cluster bacterium]|nr:MaoC/PaaZ C-terminal domain-containing protein [SAR324 cluster bacterium]
MGLFYEEFEIDRELLTQARTITEADIVAFAGLSGDYNLVHTDETFAASTPFGTRIAHGPLGLSVAIGLLSRLNVLDDTALALLELGWQFKAPIRIGDTVRVRAKAIEKRETRHAERGIVKLRLEVINQQDETVQEGTMTVMLRRRPAE